MKKTMIAVTLALSALSIQAVLAAEYSEKTQYLGVVNGQVSGNSVVKITRTPTDPVLYRNGDSTLLSDSLIVRNAESRGASDGLAYLTVKQMLPDNRYARITLKTTLMIDGKKVALNTRQQGEDIVISVPKARDSIELRTDAPIELEVPVNYRGNLQIALQVES
ncbi:DUF5462 family protein (plasmid) [Escherichia coli]|uniref:DUF5462 family protein n=1 Tax=Escherichia coli TaxID=562 RepID=UPI00145C1A15|nr:DUF5462 family protein [Escherichia coli]EFJ8922895.1 fimbrial protein [Escherichia coli]EHC4195470.1 fimbrial protein [Escherichia coli]MDX5601712.1 DUF5462 family protein [Escherichia coli]QJG00872.1 DUF5462 family protein [Escherichia coli]HAL7179883.1 fimbrial protein [Escherichia coli]